jgi:hypothetical protein
MADILSKTLKKFVVSKDKSGYRQETQNVYYSRVENNALEGIAHLCLIAENHPDERLSKIFTNETLNPLIKAILKAVADDSRAEREARQLKIAIMLASSGLDRILSIVEYNPLANHEVMRIKEWLTWISALG